MLNRRTYVSKNEINLKLPHFKLVFGLILALGYSFSFYSFLYVLREVFRLLTTFQDLDLLVLSENEVQYYNFIFALVSVILGQSFLFLYWFDTPKEWNKKRKIYNSIIVNDQRVLLYSFLSWISKLFFIFAILFGLAFDGGFYAFSLYPDYVFLFILIVIVLFLNSWTSLNFVYKRNGQKWMLINALILFLIAFCFSKVNLIDYKKINQLHLTNTLQYKYPIKLYESVEYDEIQSNSSMVKKINVALSNDSIQNNLPVIFIDNKVVEIDDLRNLLIDWKPNNFVGNYASCKLNVDVDVPLLFVNKIRKEMSATGISKVLYSVIPNQRDLDVRYYKNCVVEIKNPILGIYDFPPPNLFNKPKAISIHHQINGFLVNNLPIQDSVSLVDVIVDYARKDLSISFVYYVSDEVLFRDYLYVIESFKLASKQLKYEFALQNYFKSYQDLEFEKQMEIDNKYSVKWVENLSDTDSYK